MGIRSEANTTVSRISQFESVGLFKVNADDLEKSDSKCLNSTEVTLNDMKWKIRACRNEVDSADQFQIFLVADFVENKSDLTWEAKGKFKLFPKEGEGAIEQKIDFQKFDKSAASFGINKFTSWEDFKNKYVKDHVATIESTITTKQPTKQPSKPPTFEHTSTKVHVMIKDVSKLVEKYSSEFVMQNIRWTVLTARNNESLAAFLFANTDDMPMLHSWNVSTKFNVISSVNEQTVSKSFVDVNFNWKNSNWGYANLIKWSDFIDEKKKFVEHDSALLLVELKVGNPIIQS